MSNHLWRIYRYRNVLTDESYIGQTTKNVNERAKNGKGYSKGTKFRDAIDTYGWDTFEQSILRLCTTQEDADYWEKYFIDKYDAINNGYNIRLGDGGSCTLDKHWNHTEEARRKISESKVGEKNPFYGKKRPEHSERMKGMGNPIYGKTGEKAPSYGRTWWNNGTINIFININTTEVPDGFVKGKLQKRNSDI